MAHAYFKELHDIEEMVKSMKECDACLQGVHCKKHEVKHVPVPEPKKAPAPPIRKPLQARSVTTMS